jgi:hypothetical protein
MDRGVVRLRRVGKREAIYEPSGGRLQSERDDSVTRLITRALRQDLSIWMRGDLDTSIDLSTLSRRNGGARESGTDSQIDSRGCDGGP